MTLREDQAAADQAEALNEARYSALQTLLEAFEEPIRRADAMLRLEAWLDQHPPPARIRHQAHD